MVDHEGKELLAELTDNNIDTDWVGRHTTAEPVWIDLQFDRPVTMRSLRLLGMGPKSYPSKARVEIRRSSTGEWETLYETHAVTDFFWSGPRPYWGGRRQRMEYRFDDISVAALRVVSVEPRGSGSAWRITEIKCFSPGPSLPKETESLPELFSTLGRRNIRTLYCDRWVANRVHEKSGGSIAVELEPSFFPESPLRGGSVDWSGEPAFLVKRYDLPATQKVLAEHGIRVLETEIGPWILLETQLEAGRHTGNLYWTGFNLLNCSEATPTTAVNAEFPHGITLTGCTVVPPQVAPGGELQVTWFWRLADPAARKHPSVFVHFKHGDEMFQDDHAFFGPESTWRAGNGGQFYLLWDRRIVRVPADAAPGRRDIHIGLYDPFYGKRFRPRTDLPTARRAVVLTNALTVLEPAGEGT